MWSIKKKGIIIEDIPTIMEATLKSITFDKEQHMAKLKDFILDDSVESIKLDIKNYILRSEVEFNSKVLMTDVFDKLSDNNYKEIIEKITDEFKLKANNLGVIEVIADKHDYGTLHVSIYKINKIRASIEKKIREYIIEDAKIETLRRIARDFKSDYDIMLDIKIPMTVAEILLLNSDARTYAYMTDMINNEVLNDIGKDYDRQIFSSIQSQENSPYENVYNYYIHFKIIFN